MAPITTINIQPAGKKNIPIHIGDEILNTPNSWITTQLHHAIIITHPGILKDVYANALAKALQKTATKVTILTVPEGENSKSLTQANELITQLLTLKVERTDTIFALGGGVIGDLVGFVASIYLRGISFYQLPTSLLAQVDAAIGGKTGVNHIMGKNLIGTFYQPLAIIIDTATLETLPQREWRCGLAEIVKYGVIDAPEIFQLLEGNAPLLSSCTLSSAKTIWTQLITASANCKAKVVSADETEKGLREILNFGHTIAHAIESQFEYGTYKHGEAVAIGMVGAGQLAVMRKLWTQVEQDQLTTLLQNLGFNLKLKPSSSASLIKNMSLDKKVRQGKLRFILPTKMGKTIVCNDILETEIEQVLSNLQT